MLCSFFFYRELKNSAKGKTNAKHRNNNNKIFSARKKSLKMLLSEGRHIPNIFRVHWEIKGLSEKKKKKKFFL